MIELYNMDCMEAMKQMKDNEFDLAIVDPPYGIGIDGDIRIRKPDRPSTWDKKDKYTQKEWDNETPKAEYWKELFRVSKNQVVWGGNYFTEYLPPSKCWIFWDKLFDKTFNFSHGELAWTSFNKQLLKFTKSSKAETNGGKDRIHPTQKPVKLYEWLLTNYAKEGDKILDTHLGSGSIAIACHNLKFDLTGYELDAEYYEAATKRLTQHQAQQRLF
jgi:site-specific DNA-methyltransferase (adenine-specific)